VSGLLKKRGLKHNVLNAKHHEKEAIIVSQAGRFGAITIATNMAGRGTDILLGGHPEFLAKEMLVSKNITSENTPAEDYKRLKEEFLEEAYKITQAEHEDVVNAGGLHVIGTERHESRRIDNQLRGRAARQGDPGTTRFFLSLEDNLMRIFGGQKIFALMDTLNIDETMRIEAPMVSRSIQSAQKKVETYHFDVRKHVLEYDDVMNRQRELLYRQRRKVLEGENIFNDVLFMIDQSIDRIMSGYISPEMAPEEYDNESMEGLVNAIHSFIPQLSHVSLSDIKGLRYNIMYDMLKNLAYDAYTKHEEEIVSYYNSVIQQSEEIDEIQHQIAGAKDNIVRTLERDVLLRIVDSRWIDHLHNIDMLRDGIGLRAYGQKDPLLEYKREAFDMFNNMMHDIQMETLSHLFRTKFEIQVVQMQSEHISTDLSRAAENFITPSEEGSSVGLNGKVGRNDSCPCGSGMKYKKCCGSGRTQSRNIV